MTTQFKGLIPAVHTPMHADGSLNLDQVPRQVEYLLASGVDSLFVGGTTGEFPSLTIQERRAVAEAFVQAADERLPVIVHVGHNCLAEAQALASHAAEIGATAISAVSPSFFKPADADALLDCCARICEGARDLPFFYYHIPELSGVTVSIIELLSNASARLPALAGVKYSCETLPEITACMNQFDGRYTVMFGKDEMLLSALAAGVPAAVGSTYNYAAPLYHKLWSAFERGDIETARLCQYQAVKFIKLQAAYGGVRASKVFMKFAGVDVGPPRLPLRTLSQQKENRLRQALVDLGYFGWMET